MGAVTNCTINVCLSGCITGNTNPGCQNCVIQNCDPQFEVCAGLNVLPKPVVPPTDPVIVLVGALVPSVVLLVVCIYCGWLRYNRNLAKRQMNIQDLAKLAGSGAATPMPNQMQVAASNPTYNNMNGGYPSPYSQSKYSSPPPPPMMSPGMAPPGQVLTPYQMEYQRQQVALAQGMPIQSQKYKAPSARMSAMVAMPPVVTTNAVRLVTKFDFVGENSDELTVSVGQRLMGLEEADEWWLAKVLDTGVIGLIPSVFVEVDGPMGSTARGGITSSQVAPQF